MEQFVFSVKDKVGDSYFPLLVFQSLGDAFRSFRQYAEDNQSPFSQYPSDFILSIVGIFSDGEFLIARDELDRPYCNLRLTFSDILWCIGFVKKKYNVDDVGITTEMLYDSFSNFNKYFSEQNSEPLIV